MRVYFFSISKSCFQLFKILCIVNSNIIRKWTRRYDIRQELVIVRLQRGMFGVSCLLQNISNLLKASVFFFKKFRGTFFWVFFFFCYLTFFFAIRFLGVIYNMETFFPILLIGYLIRWKLFSEITDFFLGTLIGGHLKG